MDVTIPSGTYILVIDTTAYAGNFERELCGFITGHYDYERGHGDHEAAIFKNEEPQSQIASKITEVPHAEYGMVSNTIRATPGRLNNGMGFHYNEGDDPSEAIAKSRESMEKYQAPVIARAQDRLDREDFETDGRPGAWTREACERTIASSLASIEQAGRFVAFPAYESVAIFFSEPLTADEMALVEQRARRYASDPKAFSTFGNDPFSIRDIYMVLHEGKETRLAR